MFSKFAVFALVAFAAAQEDAVQENTDVEEVEQDSGWTESSSVLSVETLKQSNASNNIVMPTKCAKGCPCCTPKIDIKASVLESYKRHRAQVAMIGDYGSCSVGYTGYHWEVDWGDDNGQKKRVDSMAPYQAVHTYAKKGKYNVEVTLCAAKKGCETGCTSASKLVKVKP